MTPRRWWASMMPIDALRRAYRRMRRMVSRSEWSVRLLGLPRCVGSGDAPGLILIQIDGLALTQFQRKAVPQKEESRV